VEEGSNVQDVTGSVADGTTTMPGAAKTVVLEDRRAVIGRARNEVPTPALILDLDVARRNIAEMARRMSTMPARLRPHVKLHKSPQIARIQVEAGAIGVSTATVWEAGVMARAGIANILIANQVVGREKIAALAAAAHLTSMTVAVDDVRNLDDLSAAACAAGSEIGVLVEVDVGMGRSGARSADEARHLAAHASRLPGLRFLGVMGYEGHCMLEPDRELRVAKARAAMDHLVHTVDVLAAAGFACPVVSAGGTGTYDITGRNPRVTELQAGSYVFMDAFHGSLVPDFDVALTVAATVISRHGNLMVLDVGRKAIGTDLTMPRPVGHVADLTFIHEEHSGFTVDGGCPLGVGDCVELVTGYGPTTVNLYEAYNVVSNGVVVDVWPVLARGYGALGPH
jgi:D-serine deaminase-like pyridoxal phosphate-dependent protein